MAIPANILQQVQTYQMAGLAYLDNLNCFITTSNKKFKDFEKMTGNLGDTVGFDLPPRMTTTSSLVATWQPADQRIQTLTCGNAISTSYSFTSQQIVFNDVETYMKKWGKSATEEIGAKIEANVAKNCVTNTYRFYGDGVTPINSYTQLANALALFRNYGAAKGEAKGYLADTVTPNIVGSGLNQFAEKRNNEIANSWEVGEFKRCDWYESNLLPIHTAGSEGVNGTTLTVVSFTQNGPNGEIDTITFSGTHAASDASSVLQYDKFQFNDGVAGKPNVRYLTFIGHEVSANPVQFQATADAASTGGSQVTVSIYPLLQAAPNQNDQNLSTQIQAGMQVSVLPSHRAGMITAGDPLFLAMPRLADQAPYPTGNEVDPETGVTMRMTWGTILGQNQQGFIHDAIWGSTLVPEYAMALIFPL